AGDGGTNRGGISPAARAAESEGPGDVESDAQSVRFVAVVARASKFQTSILKPTKLIITGAKGRMGQTLVACAERNPELQIVGQIDLGDDLLPLIKEVDVVIDFSFHDATAQFAAVCAKHRKALVIGTTGHGDAEKSQIASLKSTIPMV